MKSKYNYRTGLWTNISVDKPKNFKQVKGRIYSCSVGVYDVDGIKIIDNIIIQYQITKEKYVDMIWFDTYIKDIIGDSYYGCNNSFFKRDGGGFPIISLINIQNKDEYFKYKKCRLRKDKLNSLI